MSGIRTGTRLERLEQVQRAARLQRAHARWRGDQPEHDALDALVRRLDREIDRERRARPELAPAVRAADQRTAHTLDQLGVDARTVKAWAVTQGLIPAVVRGRVSLALVTAYAHAHQPQEQQ